MSMRRASWYAQAHILDVASPDAIARDDTPALERGTSFAPAASSILPGGREALHRASPKTSRAVAECLAARGDVGGNEDKRQRPRRAPPRTAEEVLLELSAMGMDERDDSPRTELGGSSSSDSPRSVGASLSRAPTPAPSLAASIDLDPDL